MARSVVACDDSVSAVETGMCFSQLKDGAVRYLVMYICTA